MDNRQPYPGTPRWVKVSGIVVILLVVLVAIMLLAGHGPGRHGLSGGAGSRVVLSGVTEERAAA
jgi:hypothetical protein